MAEIDLIDRLFDKSNTENYHISIQIAPDGVSFCILDTIDPKYLLLKKYPIDEKMYGTENMANELEKIFSNDDLFKNPYKSSSLLYVTRKSTLVPSSFFDENKLKDFFVFNHELEELDELNFNYIQGIDAYNVFAIPTNIANVTYNQFRNIKFYQQSTPLIKSLVEGVNQSSAVHINLNHGFFDVVVKENHLLKFYNTFHFSNETDLLYFVVYVVNQLKINTQTALVTLSGDLSDDPSFFRSLNKYFPDLSYLEPVYPAFADVFGSFKNHRLFNLFYLYNCVS